MSSEALAWAFKQDIKPSSVKFTLVALCECANYRTGLIFPSIAHLSEITGQDRKTVISNIAELERRGLITDTGERSGKTKQVKVYSAAIGTVPTTEQSQKRNSTETAPKQSQKRDTEPSREPSSSEAKASSETHLPVRDDVLIVVSDWNAMATSAGLPTIAKLTDKRRRACLARIREDGLEAITSAIERIPRSPFLTGQTKDWRADIDFFLRPDTITKINEGRYDRSTARPVQQSPDGRSMGRTEAAGRSAYEKLAATGNFRTGGQAGPALPGGNHGRALALPDPDRPIRHVG